MPASRRWGAPERAANCNSRARASKAFMSCADWVVKTFRLPGFWFVTMVWVEQLTQSGSAAIGED